MRPTHSGTDHPGAERLAIGLGCFSLGLGLAELLAPHAIARLAGLRQDERTLATLRGLGAREVGHGLSILAHPASAPRVWARVAGDAVDLGILGAALADDHARHERTIGAIAAVLGVVVLDVATALQLTRGAAAAADDETAPNARHGFRIEKAVTINRPVHEVYGFWRRFENLPRFMRHLESVEPLGERRSRWRAKAPAGMTVEWEAELLQDREDEWIAWRSVEGADVANSGSVRFKPAPGARGTELRVQLQYSPPAGRLGRTVARLFGEEPEQQVTDDLRRFKQLMEAGEIPVSDGPGLRRAARPPKDPAELKAFAGAQS